MVAETQPLPPVKRPRKLVPFRLPESTRLSVRSLYVVHGMQPSQIALAVNLSCQQVRNLISREKWTALKLQRQASRENRTEREQLARADVDCKRVVEATAILSEDLSLRSLNLCSEYLDTKDAKSLQMASGAARNFVQIARMSRGLDRPAAGSGSQPAGSTTNLIFVGTLERSAPKAEPKQAEAVIDIPPALPGSPVNT